MDIPVNRRDLLRYSALGLVGSAAGTLAACSSGDSASNAEAPETGGKATDFTFASWSLSEDAAKPTIQKAIDGFASKDDISVKTISYPFNDYLNQLTLQVRGGQFTGAAQLDVAWLSALATLGKLTDLGSLASDRGYTEAGLGAGKFDGVQYGLPWTIGAIGLIANKELYDKAGASLTPETIEEFEDGLRALKGIGVIPYAASTKAAQLKDIFVWMQTFGSPIVKDGKSSVADEASVKAVEWYKKLYDDGLIAPDVDRAGARTLFAKGKTALYDDAPVGVSAVTDQSSDKDMAQKMTPMTRPVLASGDTPQHMLWGHLVVVTEGEGSGTAAEFAQWLTSDEKQTVSYFEALGLPPATQKALDSDAVSENTFVADFTEKITTTATPSPLWIYPGYAQVETAVAEKVQAVLIGKSSASDAMTAADQSVAKLLK